MQETLAKFELNDMLPIALTVVVLGIGVAYGLTVSEDIRDDIGKGACEDDGGNLTSYNETNGYCYVAGDSSTLKATSLSAGYNASESAIEGVGKLPEKLPLIMTVIVAVIVIGLIVRYLLQGVQ